MLMNGVEKLAKDTLGLARIVGVSVALRWLVAIATHVRVIWARRDLQPADLAMGAGPWIVRIPRSALTFRITGVERFTGIREMYVRDTYLRGGVLSIADGDVVLDLGANMGNFTNLALAHGSRVRVVAVEPNRNLNQKFHKSLALNPGFAERATLVQAFVGVPENEKVTLSRQEAFAGAAFISETELVQLLGSDHIDFLKCDIEGGEYELLRPGSRLLRMTRQLGIEIHSFAGDVQAFITMLAGEGFTIKAVQRDPDGTCTVAAAREE